MYVCKTLQEYLKGYKFISIYMKLSLQIIMQTIYLSANLKKV